MPDGKDDLVEVYLVPVQVFGTDGYGLADAIQPWSDCSRARGHIFRKDDTINALYRQPGDSIKIYIPRSELPKLEKDYSEE